MHSWKYSALIQEELSLSISFYFLLLLQTDQNITKGKPMKLSPTFPRAVKQAFSSENDSLSVVQKLPFISIKATTLKNLV